MKFGNYDPKDFVVSTRETLIDLNAKYRQQYAGKLDTGNIKNYVDAMQYAIDHYDELKPGYVAQVNYETTKVEPLKKSNTILYIGIGLLILGAVYASKKKNKRSK